METVIFESAVGAIEDVITLDDAKKQLKLEDFTFDDALIQEYINSAVSEAENIANRALYTKLYSIRFDSWRQDVVPKIQRINTITAFFYIDEDGNEVDLTASISDYVELIQINEYASMIRFKDFDNLPNLAEDTFNAVRFTVNVGYSKATLPAQIKQAVKLLVTDSYNFRNTRVQDKRYLNSASILIEPYKFYR